MVGRGGEGVRVVTLDVSKLMAYWGAAVVGAPTMYLHLWRGSDVGDGGWEWSGMVEGEMVLQAERERVVVSGRNFMVLQRIWSNGMLEEYWGEGS